jgi:acetyl-CoA synthetase
VLYNVRMSNDEMASNVSNVSNDAKLASDVTEDRVFPPSAEFAAQANAKAGIYEEATLDSEGFWAK